jgi:dihydrofolate reductase
MTTTDARPTNTRKIIAITQLSVDGVMQAPGGPEEDPTHGFTHGGWAMPYGDDTLSRVIDETMSGAFDLLLGRRTYDIFAGYWPHQHDNIAKAFNEATKFVVTSRPDPLGWKTSQRIGGDVAREIAKLKAAEGPELHVWGSSRLLQTLITADLVDEYRMWIAPVVLGKGKRLFESAVPPRALSLIETQRTSTGLLIHKYRPAGLIPEA